MAWVCLLIGVCLGVIAYRVRRDSVLMVTMACFAVLNGWAALHMMATDYPQAYRIVANPFN